jgi:hypothetical protein
MFTLLSRRFFLSTISVLLIFIHLTVEAAIVRGAGRGGTTDSSATQYFLVDDSYVNSLGLDASFVALASTSLQSGRFEAGATPRDCYREFGFGDDFGFIPEPCYYDSLLSDRLVLEGFSAISFGAPAVGIATWSIGNGITSWSQSFDMLGSDTSIIDIVMPAGLTPGDYTVSFSVTYTAGAGRSFFINNDIHNNNPDNCGELIDGDPDSYTCSYGYSRRSELSFGYSERFILRADPISEPGTVLLMLFGLAGLILRRRQI